MMNLALLPEIKTVKISAGGLVDHRESVDHAAADSVKHNLHYNFSADQLGS
jgi:hypothetical protein